MPKPNQKTIYVPNDLMHVWEEIEKAANDAHHGVGLFLCEYWKSNKITADEVIQKNGK